MRHPSKHQFFLRFLVPDQRYSDSAGCSFWTAHRSTKTRTFQRPLGRRPAHWRIWLPASAGQLNYTLTLDRETFVSGEGKNCLTTTAHGSACTRCFASLCSTVSSFAVWLSLQLPTHTHTFVFVQIMPCNVSNLRVLGSPNPGQSFGRGLSGPQATEVSRDPRGSWAATNLTVHSLNSFLGPSFWVRALGSYS